MSSDAQTLLADAKCLLCHAGSSYGLGLLETYALTQIVGESNPATLLAEAKCFACSGSSDYELELMETALYVRIFGEPATAPPACVACNGSSLYSLDLMRTMRWMQLAGLSDAGASLTAASPFAGHAMSDYMLKLIHLALLSRIAGMSDPATLLAEAKCLSCYHGRFSLKAIQVGLMITDVSVSDFVQRAGITDETQIAALNALATAAKAHGWWAKCDLIYPFVGGTAQAHAQNLKSSSFTITWHGTVTHNANGITGDGTTGYGQSGWNPANEVTADDAHCSVYCRTQGTSSRDYFSTTTGSTIRLFNSGTNFFGRFLDASNSAIPFLAGLFGVSRYAAGEKHLYTTNEVIVATAASLTVSGELYVLARNNFGAPASFSDANLAGITAGSGITFAEFTAMRADWQAFQTALGRAV